MGWGAQWRERYQDDIPIGTDAPVRRRAEPGDRRTVGEELDDLTAWAREWNEQAHQRWVKKHGGE